MWRRWGRHTPEPATPSNNSKEPAAAAVVANLPGGALIPWQRVQKLRAHKLRWQTKQLGTHRFKRRQRTDSWSGTGLGEGANVVPLEHVSCTHLGEVWQRCAVVQVEVGDDDAAYCVAVPSRCRQELEVGEPTVAERRVTVQDWRRHFSTTHCLDPQAPATGTWDRDRRHLHYKHAKHRLQTCILKPAQLLQSLHSVLLLHVLDEAWIDCLEAARTPPLALGVPLVQCPPFLQPTPHLQPLHSNSLAPRPHHLPPFA